MTDFLTLNVQHPDEQLFNESAVLLEQAERWKIVTPEMVIDAGEDLKKVKALYRQVESQRTSITGPINKAVKDINALFKPAKSWLQEAEAVLKSKIMIYQNEQDRIAREAQAKADAEALEERKRLERKAKVVEAIGRPERAAEIREEAETKIAPVVKSAAPKMEGVVRRETWKAEVTDKRLLLKYIGDERPDLLGLLQINQSALNDLARMYKDEVSLPGVEFKKEASIAARN